MRVLDQLASFRRYPCAVLTDKGPEFTSRAFIAWTQQRGIEHILIEPGRSMQNGYIQSFNGKFRDECLHDHWANALAEARQVFADWRHDYNEVRPHNSCGHILPSQFAANHRAKQINDAAAFNLEPYQQSLVRPVGTVHLQRLFGAASKPYGVQNVPE